ncbi:hypothetical protein SAMN04489740_0983 [Arthrobacter alpinus]|uniref:Uncharacterized protein n=1 Tax=Arthrobacter alpinus TaxID=656366 RepID=A0A1H5HD81_9MICC|nr:hypothetical protein SAMN04489740_0983 [Arthrobacter alpinus]
MNPDCRDVKHRSCAGDGWDEATDAAAPCPCTCHGLTEWQVEYFARVMGITTEEARAIAHKILNLPEIEPAKPAFLLTKRRTALKVKTARGKGPPSSESWRGRARTTKFRSQ